MDRWRSIPMRITKISRIGKRRETDVAFRNINDGIKYLKYLWLLNKNRTKIKY